MRPFARSANRCRHRRLTAKYLPPALPTAHRPTPTIFPGGSSDAGPTLRSSRVPNISANDTRAGRATALPFVTRFGHKQVPRLASLARHRLPFARHGSRRSRKARSREVIEGSGPSGSLPSFLPARPSLPRSLPCVLAEGALRAQNYIDVIRATRTAYVRCCPRHRRVLRIALRSWPAMSGPISDGVGRTVRGGTWLLIRHETIGWIPAAGGAGRRKRCRVETAGSCADAVDVRSSREPTHRSPPSAPSTVSIGRPTPSSAAGDVWSGRSIPRMTSACVRGADSRPSGPTSVRSYFLY